MFIFAYVCVRIPGGGDLRNDPVSLPSTPVMMLRIWGSCVSSQGSCLDLQTLRAGGRSGEPWPLPLITLFHCSPPGPADAVQSYDLAFSTQYSISMDQASILTQIQDITTNVGGDSDDQFIRGLPGGTGFFGHAKKSLKSDGLQYAASMFVVVSPHCNWT